MNEAERNGTLITGPSSLPAPADAYSPEAVINAFCANLRAPEESKLLTVRGIYQPNLRGQNYAGYFYDELKELFGDTTLKLKVPARLRAELDPAELYYLQGSLQKRPRGSGVEITLVVSDILGREERRTTPEDERQAELLLQKLERGSKDIEGLLRELLMAGAKPRVHLILGHTAVTLEDVTQALGGTAGAYELIEERVSLARPNEIAHALEQAEADVVAVVRGGGSGLETFDDLQLAEAALSLRTPLITAIGHAEDRTLLERMADQAFTTPTALGGFLRDLAEEVQALNERSRLLKELREDLQREREERQQDKRQAARQVRIAWIIVGLLLLLLLLSLLLR